MKNMLATLFFLVLLFPKVSLGKINVDVKEFKIEIISFDLHTGRYAFKGTLRKLNSGSLESRVEDSRFPTARPVKVLPNVLLYVINEMTSKKDKFQTWKISKIDRRNCNNWTRVKLHLNGSDWDWIVCNDHWNKKKYDDRKLISWVNFINGNFRRLDKMANINYSVYGREEKMESLSL